MAQEEKLLLLQDLCARLPYKVICKIHYTFNNETTFGEDVETEDDCTLIRIDVQNQIAYLDWICDWFCIEDVKPYLRPMSSMTEEERKECNKLRLAGGMAINVADYCDWLNAHHFDYRGLIEKGLALEATEGMYNIKEK